MKNEYSKPVMAIVGFDYFNLLSASPAGYSGPLGVRRI